MGVAASTLGDVYSYGILLLEMITRKRPTDDMFMDELDLHNYVNRALAGQVYEIVDHLLLSKAADGNKRMTPGGIKLMVEETWIVLFPCWKSGSNAQKNCQMIGCT